VVFALKRFEIGFRGEMRFPPGMKAAFFSCLLMSAVLVSAGYPSSASAAPRTTRIYIGTYGSGPGKGIYTALFDTKTGKLSAPELAAEARSPSFLALHPNGNFLYAVGEVDNFEGKNTGIVSSYQIEKTSGKLTLNNQQSSGGAGPCHLAVDRNGLCLLTANYGSGSVASYAIAGDGILSAPVSVIQHQGSSINPSRQQGPHAHFITADRDNFQALACDLGLDQVLLYGLDASEATLTRQRPPAINLPPGSGPRHLVFHPKRDWVYVVNELNSTVSSLIPEQGHLAVRESVSTLPDGFKGQNSCAEIQIHPSGSHLYASNRGHDSVAIFAVDKKTGLLERRGHQATGGKTPRFFAFDPAGRWLLAANQDSNNIVVFRVDQKTGLLQPANQTLTVPSPVCVVFAP